MNKLISMIYAMVTVTSIVVTMPLMSIADQTRTEWFVDMSKLDDTGSGRSEATAFKTIKAAIAEASVALTPLPDEHGSKPPISPFPFPDALSAYVWRNWGLVPTERLADVVGATVADMNEIAGEMGLAPNPHVLPEWRRRGYITVVRRNWHLLPYDQLIRLIDMTREEFAFSLKEDDFLYSKLGLLKPACARLEWSRGAAMAGSEGRRRIASVLAEEGIDPNADEEPRFAFVKEYAAAESGESTVHEAVRRKSAFDFRMIASYFADYGDPLADDEISSFPDGLLQKLEKEGVNAVWMHVVVARTDPENRCRPGWSTSWHELL